MSIDFLILNQIKKLETEAEYYEKKGEKDKAYEVYEKIANLYEKAASKALLQSTRELYLMKAEEYRSRINTTKEKINGDEPDYIQKADGMIEKTNLTWDNISGLEKIKSLLRQAVGIAISKPEKPVKMDPPRSILLFGPPGTGKTLLASAASNSINATFFNADISKILSRYVGDSPKTVDALFLLARKMSPSIIFFDEFDAISLNREEKENIGTGLIQKILTEMDGFRKSRDFVMVIASTNRPWALDEAILNRFDYRIYVPLPDFEARKGIFEIALGKNNFEIEADYDDLAKRTEGYSGREISGICRKAILSMIKRMNPDIENARPGYKLRIGKITKEELYKAIEETKPSVSKEMIKKYEEWNREYGSG